MLKFIHFFEKFTSAFMNVMIMTWQTEGALNSPVMRITFHCQAPMWPSLARIWSSSLAVAVAMATLQLVAHYCRCSTNSEVCCHVS